MKELKQQKRQSVMRRTASEHAARMFTVVQNSVFSITPA